MSEIKNYGKSIRARLLSIVPCHLLRWCAGFKIH